MNSPKATFLMTAYNAETYIRESIQSVLSQSYKDFILLIIDDASTDSTAEIIASFKDPRIQVIRNEINLGTAEASNVGLDHIKTEYILRIDSDDICEPGRLALQLKFMEHHHNVGVCGSFIEFFGLRKEVWKMPLEDAIIRARLIWDNVIANSSVIIRTKVLRDHHIRYDSRGRKPPMEDYQMWLQLVPFTQFANIPQVLVKKREHAKSLSAIYKEQMLTSLGELYTFAFANLGLKATPEEIKLHLLGKVQPASFGRLTAMNYKKWQEKVRGFFYHLPYMDNVALDKVNKWKHSSVSGKSSHGLMSKIRRLFRF